MKAETAQTSLSGLPTCSSTELKPDGKFQTYCTGFGSGFGGSSMRCLLSGDLTLAKLEVVPRFGAAEFHFVKGENPQASRGR